MTKKEMDIFHYGDDRYTKQEFEVADVKFFARWEYILDEMIWAFEQIIDGESVAALDALGLAYHERIKRGTTFFGKYYSSLWD